MKWCRLTVPTAYYDDNKNELFDELHRYFNSQDIEMEPYPNDSFATINLYTDNINSDFPNEILGDFRKKYQDVIPMKFWQESCEGGYDHSAGTTGYSIPGQEFIEVANNNTYNYIAIKDLKNISSLEELHKMIADAEEKNPIPDMVTIFEEYNDNYNKDKLTPKTKEELKTLVDDEKINLGEINVSNITDMSNLFNETTRVDFSGIEKWDVSHVTDMSYMFCNSFFNHPIGSWDVSKVTDMSYMFCNSNFNHPIGSWDVSKVENMEGMFELAPFNQSIVNWNVSNVKSMRNMFSGSDFNQPLEKWNIKDVNELGLKAQEQKITSFEEALAGLVKSHIEAGESLPDIGKQLKVATEKTMLELGKAHVSGRNGR